MILRTVACAWCGAPLRVAAPELDSEAYFVLPRRCRDCAGNNTVELLGAIATAAKVVRRRAAVRHDTARITLAEPGVRRRLSR
jgi:hypothetical protein